MGGYATQARGWAMQCSPAPIQDKLGTRMWTKISRSDGDSISDSNSDATTGFCHFHRNVEIRKTEKGSKWKSIATLIIKTLAIGSQIIYSHQQSSVLMDIDIVDAKCIIIGVYMPIAWNNSDRERSELFKKLAKLKSSAIQKGHHPIIAGDWQPNAWRTNGVHWVIRVGQLQPTWPRSS